MLWSVSCPVSVPAVQHKLPQPAWQQHLAEGPGVWGVVLGRKAEEKMHGGEDWWDTFPDWGRSRGVCQLVRAIHGGGKAKNRWLSRQLRFLKIIEVIFISSFGVFFFLTEWTHSSLWSRDKQFSGAVWQTFVRGSGWREGRVVSEKQSGTTGVLLQTEQVCINLRKMSKGTESETAVFGLISVASVPLSGCEDAVFPPVVVSWHSVGRYLGQLLLICLCLCTFLI